MAVDVADRALAMLENVPGNKHLRLVSQMEGAITSISLNIAEGRGRQSKREFIQFLSIAEASLYETVTLVEIFRRRKLFSEEDCQELRSRCEAIDRKINGLKNSLKGRMEVEGDRLKTEASNLRPLTSNLQPQTLTSNLQPQTFIRGFGSGLQAPCFLPSNLKPQAWSF